VIERVRQDDPVAYLRTVAILVRGVPNTEPYQGPFSHLSDEELRAEMIAIFLMPSRTFGSSGGGR
jgi:hypothetical protein